MSDAAKEALHQFTKFIGEIARPDIVNSNILLTIVTTEALRLAAAFERAAKANDQ